MMSTSVIAGERIVIKDQKIINQEVSKKTVLCSAKGYGLEELKINIEALNGWTFLDHSNLRFGDKSGLPCMTAGRCIGPLGDELQVDDVVLNNPRIETITIYRELIETRFISSENSKDCLRAFKEKLATNIAGIAFHHERWSNQDVLPAAACTF